MKYNNFFFKLCACNCDFGTANEVRLKGAMYVSKQ